jgi:hypothetical protein
MTGKKRNRPKIRGLLFFLILISFNELGWTKVRTDKNLSKAQMVFYASPAGSGEICSNDHPGSLTSVRNKVRKITPAMKRNIVINLKGGTYHLKSAIQLGPEDSGTNGFSVVWQANPGEVPKVSGGKVITGWSLFDKRKNIWKTNVGSSFHFRQLYVNGTRAIRARIPNMECNPDKGPYARIYSWNNFHPVIPASLLTSLKNNGKVEFCVNHYWQHFRYRIDSLFINGDSAKLSFRLPEAGIEHPCIDDSAPFFIENAYELLDAEGEWFLNSENGDLFYKPFKGEIPENVQIIAPTLETVLRIDGSSSEKVHDIQFRGITFEHSTWLAPDERGYTAAQAAIGMDIPGIVEVSNANHILFERNIFKHAGGFGLVFSSYSDHNRIIGNVITDISANGIVMDPMFSKTKYENVKDSVYSWMVSENGMKTFKASSSYDLIKNNLVEFCGRDYNDAVGIYASFPEHLIIEHNEIRNLTYSGISIGWSWRKEITPHRDDEVSYNKIHDVCLTNCDGGGIYILGKVSGNGTRVHHNYIYNVNSPNGWASSWPMAGLYCDGPGSTNVLFDYNVVNNCRAAFQNGTHTNNPNLQFNNNYWRCVKLWSGNGAGDEANTKAKEYGNVHVTDNNWPEEAKTIMRNAGIEAEYQDISGLTDLNHN